MTKNITAYICTGSTYSQRVEIALEEAQAEYTAYQIDLRDKPEWFSRKVNPAGKVPALAYGGPKVDPENPSPDSTKLAESLVLLEFIADLYPQSGLLSLDPVERAKTRFVIDTFTTKYVPAQSALLKGESPDPLYAGILALQELLVDAKPFLGGDKLNIADAAIAPLVIRLELQLKNDIGTYPEGDGPKIHAEVFQSERFETFRKYVKALSERKSVKDTFPESLWLGFIKSIQGPRKSVA